MDEAVSRTNEWTTSQSALSETYRPTGSSYIRFSTVAHIPGSLKSVHISRAGNVTTHSAGVINRFPVIMQPRDKRNGEPVTNVQQRNAICTVT